MEEKIELTQSAYKQLQARLTECTQLLETAKAQREAARKLGDLSENSEFDAAVANVERYDEEIRSIKDQLSRAKIVQGVSTSSSVGIGSKVVIHEVGDGQNPPVFTEDLTIQICSSGRGGPPNNVSIDSLMGAAIKGCKKGSEFSYIDNLARTRIFKVQDILTT